MLRILYISLLLAFIFGNQSPLMENYHTYEEIQSRLNDWYDLYGNNSNPNPTYYQNSGIIYDLKQIGVSNVNQLPIYAVKLSYDVNVDSDKPKVLILGQCHAEEIYGVEISMALIEMFLDPSLISNSEYEYLPDPSDVNPFSDLKNILKRIELWVVPTHNPDGLQVVHGYEDENLNWVQDVSYRKNITDVNNNGIFDFIAYEMGTLNAGNDIDGVDLNRNYDFHFGKGGDAGSLNVEDDYQSCGFGEYRSSYDYYRGESAFSESELQAIRQLALEENFTFSIAYHSSRSGCVSEKVIYPWDWKGEGKVSPDYNAISFIGDRIAEKIPTQDENIHGLLHYKGASSYSRRGQAHDWFYAKTGCFQYLIEAGIGGDEGIQTSSIDFYNQVIKNNFHGLFYLLRRSMGVSLNTDVEQYGVTGIVLDNNSNLPIEGVIYKIDELDSGILEPRKTNTFGRYRWILSSEDNSRHISFIHWDYEPLLSQNFNISSTSITDLDVQLIPKTKYQTQFSLSGPDEALLVLTNNIGLVDSIVLSTTMGPLSIPEGIYDYQISSEGYYPLKGQLNINNATSIDASLVESAYSRLRSSSLNSLYSENDLYDNNLDTCIEYDNILNDYSHLKISMAYELEWERDSLFIFLANDEIPEYIFSGHDWNDKEYYIDLDSSVDYSDLKLKFCIKTDSSFGYRGVKINQVSGLGNACFDDMACNYGADQSCDYPDTCFNCNGDCICDTDCLGDCGGDAVYDECGVCDGLGPEDGYDCDGNFLQNIEIVYPDEYRLYDNFPNPFNPATQILFSLVEPSKISINVYGINGDLVDVIIDNKYYNSGLFSVIYKPENLSSGIYFCHINNGKQIIVNKMIYLK